MALPYTGTLSDDTPVEITGCTSGAELLVLASPGLYLDMDNSAESGDPNWQQVHANKAGGSWRGPQIGTKLRLRKDPQFASLTARIIEQ